MEMKVQPHSTQYWKDNEKSNVTLTFQAIYKTRCFLGDAPRKQWETHPANN